MEAAVVSALMTNIVARVFAVVEKRYDQLSSLHDDIESMKGELHMIAGDMEDQLLQKGKTRAVQNVSLTVMRELAFDIEDCLDRFLPCAACDADQPVSIDDPVQFVDEIQKLKKRLEGAHQLKSNYRVGGSQQVSDHLQGQPADSDDADPFEDPSHHVGMEKPKLELLDLLQDEREKLMVISIVGFGGSGKTALAKAVYHCPQVRRNYLRRAWVVASKHKDDAKGLLTAILQQLLPSEAPAVPPTQQVDQLQQHIRHHLRARSTRCLIVIDDIQEQHWSTIEPIISVETSSRILVTTTVHSLANTCSSDDGYVYKMRTLSAEDSKVLLKKKVSFFKRCTDDSEDGSAAIVHKCYGHPLTLVSVANHLLGVERQRLTGKFCEDTSRRLGFHMEENKLKKFTKLRQVLMNNYSSLPGSSLKTCLLYTSLFPNDRPVSRKTLARRWLAEGYIFRSIHDNSQSDLEFAEDKLDELIDRNIILCIDASNNGKAKTCKAHGIMNQFILHKSTASNFITPSFGAVNRSNFRHQVIENNSNGIASLTDNVTNPATSGHNFRLSSLWNSSVRKADNLFTVKKLRPRSLTVFGNAGEGVYSDLTNCKLLRVLDLKECNDDLTDEHLQIIYSMLHLKYLTLPSSVSKLSAEMKRLHCLETLDLRKTKIEILPLQIITLPHLAHLFGKIKINKLSRSKLKNFQSGKSNLQTLAGVVIDKDSGFPGLMVHMTKLTKVNIWCETITTESNYNLLSKAIDKFAMDGLDTPQAARSISLHLNDSYQDLLPRHQGYNEDGTPKKALFLSSLKLHGRPSQFKFVESITGLQELCLTSTSLTASDLSKLSAIRRLLYLKLVEVHLADLEIKLGDFQSLQRLCFVVQEPRFPTIQEGALQSLVSLQLLCKSLVGLCDHIQVESFGRLQEIALDSMVNKETIRTWENEARKHPMRPRVLFLRRVDPADTRSAVKYVATDRGSSEVPM